MIPTQTFENYPIFGACATKIQPGDAKRENGFIEGDVYPAEWVNWKWAKDSQGISTANTGLCSIEQELNTVLCCAGITPSSCLSCADQVYNAMMCKIQDCVGTAAPKAHASAETTYGVGTADCYGHLKISDTYTSVLAACTGVAASQLAVACVYSVANGKAAVGNTAGCALGTATAGTATTAARSDHVHPMPIKTICPFIIEPNCNPLGEWSYNEGLRINRGCTTGYANIVLGTRSGTCDGICEGFWIGTNIGSFGCRLYINYNAYSKESYFCSHPDGRTFWHGDVDGTASCAGKACSICIYSSAPSNPFINRYLELCFDASGSLCALCSKYVVDGIFVPYHSRRFCN